MQSLYDEIKREEPDLAEQMSFEDYLKIFMLLCALFLFPILAIGVILEIWENFKNN
jgi:nitrate reductase NapE component